MTDSDGPSKQMSDSPVFGTVPDQHPLSLRGQRVGQLADPGRFLGEAAARRDHPRASVVVADDLVRDRGAVDLDLRHFRTL